MKQFLADGKDYIDAYRSIGGNLLDRKLLITYSLIGVFLIGGALVASLWILPRVWPVVPGYDNGNAVWYNPAWDPATNKQMIINNKEASDQ